MGLAIGAFGLAVLGLAITSLALHNTEESNSISISNEVDSPKGGLLDALFPEEMAKLKAKAFQGLAWLGIKILNSQLEENAINNSIEDCIEGTTSGLGDALGRAIADIDLTKGSTNNVSCDIIDNNQGSISSMSISSDNEITNDIPVDNFWGRTREETPSITGVPAIPKEGPTIWDTPASDIPEPSITGFPAIPKEGPQITGIPGDTGLDVPIITGFPASKSQTVESTILKTTSKEVQRTDEIELGFNRNPDHDESEFERQIKAQEEGLNNLSIADYLKNRTAYKNNGRSKEGAKAQRKARRAAEKAKMNELISNLKISVEEAKAKAKEWIKTQAALHNPDQAAGGDPTNITGVGDAAINKSIGAQWKKNAVILEEAVRKYMEEHNLSETAEELKDIYLNVKLKF